MNVVDIGQYRSVKANTPESISKAHDAISGIVDDMIKDDSAALFDKAFRLLWVSHNAEEIASLLKGVLEYTQDHL